MCLLTFIPTGAAPDVDALRIGAHANNHEHGFAIGTVTGRGMRAEEVIDEFLRARAERPDAPALFHSRFTTHGTIGPDHCHPFRLGKDRQTVIAHNGILPQRVQPGPSDQRSDTRIAAEEYLPRHPFGSPDSHRGRRGLESWLGASKLVLLTTNPAYAHHAYIFNEHAGIWDGGIWYSNSGYRPDRRLWLSMCGHCRTIDPLRRGRYCGTCGWCFVCLIPFPDCECSQRMAHAIPVTSLPHTDHC